MFFLVLPLMVRHLLKLTVVLALQLEGWARKVLLETQAFIFLHLKSPIRKRATET